MIVNFDSHYFFGADPPFVKNIISNMEKHVTMAAIPKKDGSKRKILVPSPELKNIQRNLYYKFFKRYKHNSAAHGFVKKRGIVSNAKEHVGAKSMGIVDIKNFFNTISKDHLKNVLFGNKNICKCCANYPRMMCKECDPSIYKNNSTKFKYTCDELLAMFNDEYCLETGYISLFQKVINACTYNGFIAQGFPTSPIIANIVMVGFDKKLVKKFEPLGITYTRYADDLCFSSKVMSKEELKDACQIFVYKALWSFGFAPNRKKTLWKNCSSRLSVCGIVVNKKLSIRRRDVLKFRAKVHHITVKNKDTVTRAQYNSARGWASFLMSVDKEKGKKYYNQLAAFGKDKGW
jgi:retron-type reverse transcriptase